MKMEEQKENMRKLAALTAILPFTPAPHQAGSPVDFLHPFIELAAEKTRIEYVLEGGICYRYPLFTDVKNICVDRWYVSKGGVHGPHIHRKQVELIFVYIGKIEMTVAGEIRIVSAGEHLFIGPEVHHSAKFLEDTWIITIVYPSGDYESVPVTEL